jgi:hypothetical protein
MDLLQKKYIAVTSLVFVLILCLGFMVRSLGDPYLLTVFYHLFVRYDPPAAFLSILVLFAGTLLALKTKASWVDVCLDYIGNNTGKIAVAMFFMLAFGAYFVYFRHPLSMDEYMPYFQARIFAEGKLWGQFPPELMPWLLKPAFFSVFNSETGHVVSNYWPGFALLLAPFMKIGVPWILNPLISAGTLLLFFYYLRKIFPDSNLAASWGLLLTLGSSVFLVDGISYYSMSAHLFLNLLYAVLLIKISPLRLFLAGLVGSLALVLHNPVPHFAFALPWIIWIGLRKDKVRNLGMLFAGYLPISIIMGFGWVWLKLLVAEGTGAVLSNSDTFTSQQVLSQAAADSLKNPEMNLTFLSKVVSLITGTFRIPDLKMIFERLIGWLKVFAWSVPGLPVLAILGLRFIKGSTHLKLWVWSAATTIMIFIFVPFNQGHGWGFRYFHSVWLVLPLLGAAFLAVNELKGAAYWKKFMCVLSLLSIFLFTGLRFYQVHQYVGQHLAQLPEFEPDKKYICILNTEQGYYSDDLIQNNPFLRDPIIILRSIDGYQDLKMIQTFFPDANNILNTPSYLVWEIE